MDSTGTTHLHAYADTQALAEGLAQALHAGSAGIGSPLLALAGGRTPFPAYRAWVATLPAGCLPRVLPTDDRCVAHTHNASNLRELRAAVGERATLLPMTAEDGDEGASLRVARGTLAALPTFDAVVLGMGADGHFASLFPGAVNLDEGLSPGNDNGAILTTPVPLPPEAPFSRISLTLPRLLDSRTLHLCVTGNAKREVLERAATQSGPLPYPIAALLGAAGPRLHIHWSP